MKINNCDNKHQMALLSLIVLGKPIKGFNAELAARIAVEVIQEEQEKKFGKFQ